jgi:hypothetical protein
MPLPPIALKDRKLLTSRLAKLVLVRIQKRPASYGRYKRVRVAAEGRGKRPEGAKTGSAPKSTFRARTSP